MTTSNLRHPQERHRAIPEAICAHSNTRLTRRSAQLTPVTTMEAIMESQHLSPALIEKSKGLSPTGSIPQQQPLPLLIKPHRVNGSLRQKGQSGCNLSISKQQNLLSTPSREVHKSDLEPTSRKNEQQVSISLEDDYTSSLPIVQNLKKRSLLDLTSPYMEQRKSYRKAFIRKDRDYIPFRRSQDALEGKIVNIINKLLHGKSCGKDIMHLTEKMGKLSQRQLFSRHIVSGFSVITRILGEISQSFEEELVLKVKQANLKISELIDQEIDNCEEFDGQIQEPEIDQKVLGKFLIRKVYSLLKEANRSKLTNQSLQDQALRISQDFIKNDSLLKSNVVRLLRRVREPGTEFIDI